jgi:hypothetical protein
MGALRARRRYRGEVTAAASDQSQTVAATKKETGARSFLEKFAWVNAERRRDLADRIELGTCLSILHFTDKALMLARVRRQFGLRQATRLAQPAHVLCQYGADV